MQGCAFLGSRKHFDPNFLPQPVNFFMGLRKFQQEKALTMAMLTCQLPLII